MLYSGERVKMQVGRVLWWELCRVVWQHFQTYNSGFGGCIECHKVQVQNKYDLLHVCVSNYVEAPSPEALGNYLVVMMACELSSRHRRLPFADASVLQALHARG